jgi:tetratricopeptide (TPR) repeat protein
MAIERAPDNGYIVNTLGAGYYRTGNWKAAIEALKQAEELSQGQFFSSDAFFIAMAHWQLGDKDAARKWYNAGVRWMAKFKDNDEQRRFRAEAATLLKLPASSPVPAQGAPKDDLELYTLIVGAFPEAAWAYFNRAQTHQSRGALQKARRDYHRALALYTQAIVRKPSAGVLLFNRGNAYAELGQPDKASADFAKGAADKKAGPAVWYRHALLRLQLNDTAGYRRACATLLQRFSKTEPDATANLAAWGCAFAPEAVADDPRLVRWARRLVAAQPKDFVPLTTLGAVLYRAGRFDEAVKRLNDARAAYKPGDEQRAALAYTCYFLAMAHHRLGHAAQARRWLDKAVRQSQPQKPAQASGVPVPWNRRLTLQLLGREAEQLLKRNKS